MTLILYPLYVKQPAKHYYYGHQTLERSIIGLETLCATPKWHFWRCGYHPTRPTAESLLLRLQSSGIAPNASHGGMVAMAHVRQGSLDDQRWWIAQGKFLHWWMPANCIRHDGRWLWPQTVEMPHLLLATLWKWPNSRAFLAARILTHSTAAVQFDADLCCAVDNITGSEEITWNA